MKLLRPKLLLSMAVLLLPALLLTRRAAQSQTQDWLEIGINRGQPMIRLALTDFPAQSGDQQLATLTQEFNQVLHNDLDNAGIFTLVSKSNFPLKVPVEPADVDFKAWTDSPASAQMLVFGKTEAINQNLVITCRLFDVQSPASPTVGRPKRYVATLNEISARESAHRFANEIIQTLGGGVPGINLTRMAFVSNRRNPTHPEIWVMDYDGFNQRPITSYGSLSLTPRWSPDNTRLAFTSYILGNPDIFVFSLETNRRIPFPRYKGLNTTPAWSPDGKKIAFCSSMSGDPEIYLADATGYNLQRLTFSPGVDISPIWNPKTGNELAFVSDRSGSPQIYIMSSDGTNLRRLVSKGGDASGPAWSANGQFIAFQWRLTDTGTYDIYVIEIATGRIVQLTHDAGRNEHPWWAPDGRHLSFESNRTGSKQVWLMLADGSNPKQLTHDGDNWNPSWSN
jgi:TolB protein